MSDETMIDDTRPDDVIIADLRRKLEAAAANAADYATLGKAAVAARDDMAERLKAVEKEREELRAYSSSLERQLERSKGYIDRVLEIEDARESPRVREEPLPPTARGPRLDTMPSMELHRASARPSSWSVAQFDGGRRY